LDESVVLYILLMYSDKKVDIKISKRNFEYYKGKGYVSTLQEIITIKCCDISQTVSTKIYVICEFCKQERYIKSLNYHNQIKKKKFICLLIM